MTSHRQKTLEVCLAPDLLGSYSIGDKLVVVIDIFRASSAICTAIAHGVKEIIPIDSIEEAHRMKDAGYIVAAERKGEVVNGFDFGNSPFSFMGENIRGKSIALTTTNCTHAIHMAKNAKKLLIGSFLNISAMEKYLSAVESDLILLCAGWNNNFNLEDTVYAGALADRLKSSFDITCDSAISAMMLYNTAKNDIPAFLKHSSHSHRLQHLHLEKDIAYCLLQDETDIIPILEGNSLVEMV